MNLFTGANVREFRPALGKVNPATHQFDMIPPRWSPPRVRIIAGEDSAQVAAEVSGLLADDAIHVCAISPVAIGPGWHPYRYCEGGEPAPYFVVTVVVQERIAPAAAPAPEPLIETWDADALIAAAGDPAFWDDVPA